MTLQVRAHGTSRDARQSSKLDFPITRVGDDPERAVDVDAESVSYGVELQSRAPRWAWLGKKIARHGEPREGGQK
jgi:hypothetical protein